ncbi:MAG: hypothetical protein AAF152_21790 [Cyanobacteria bacterium P01_A01_bin.114]
MSKDWIAKLGLALTLAGQFALPIGIVSITNIPTARAEGFEASPFQLFNLAYEGYLEEAGIPSRARLERLYHYHDIVAEDIVAAGVEAGYIPDTTLEDARYINAVRLQMQSLRDRDRFHRWRDFHR